jgi:hypothetical protein
MMLGKNIMRRYPSEQEDVKPTSKLSAIAAIIPKRRALGDITNAYTDETKDNNAIAKKPQFFQQANNNPPQPETLDTQSEMQQSNSCRPYMDRVCDDVDARDTDNPLLVTCYVNELYETFNELEKTFSVSPTYMSRQEYVNEKMRTILVDWLVILFFCSKLNFL